jgi:uncharacterized membrane protein
MGSTAAVVVFSVLAVGEYIADLLPTTPRRTTPGPLVARAVMGGLSGASLCASANRSVALGVIIGAIGGVIGAFAGYESRARLVRSLNVKDRVVAVCEDVVALALAYLMVSPQ